MLAKRGRTGFGRSGRNGHHRARSGTIGKQHEGKRCGNAGTHTIIDSAEAHAPPSIIRIWLVGMAGRVRPIRLTVL
ncbi:hypothetical protein [Pontibaca methylaminivorans]|uniref:hypothetical protein n=1 Tax=Pontibaca methylaminivorans TaxID=515897 RepID=UPI002FD91A14